MDYGFDYYKRECDNEQLINVFDACGTPCHEIRENKFYYCVMARSVADNLSVNVGKEDYLDFEKLSGDNWRRELLEFIMGYSEKDIWICADIVMEQKVMNIRFRRQNSCKYHI